jgi:transposase
VVVEKRGRNSCREVTLAFVVVHKTGIRIPWDLSALCPRVPVMLVLDMNFIGIDVGKTYLDIADSANKTTLRVKNTESGFKKILENFPGDNAVCMEATGIYYLNVANFLSKSAWSVFVVNPKVIKHYKESLLSRIKTDKVDSIHISKFLSERYSELNRFVVKENALFVLTILVNFIESLKKQKTQMKNRMHAVSFIEPNLFPEFQQSINVIDDQIKTVQNRALYHVKSNKLLLNQVEALVKLPGFGEISALNLLVSSGGFERFKSARAFACFCGLTPKFHESGQLKKRPKMSKMGSPRARATLWLAALVAVRGDSKFGDSYRSLILRGKKPSVALVAVANRLARAAWVVTVKPETIKNSDIGIP